MKQTSVPEALTGIQAEDGWVRTHHGRLYFKRWDGTADSAAPRTPIVLFHDSLGCVELWREFPVLLARRAGRSVIAYDRLGFGRSDPHQGKLDTAFIRDEPRCGFRAVREHLGLADFIAFGHSVGGCMAVAAAARYPSDCSALITVSAQAFVEQRTIDGIRDARRMFAQPGQIDRLKKYHVDKAPWVLSAWIDTWLSPEFAHWTLDEDLRAVRCPVLAMHGVNDEYGSPRHPERIAELVEGPSTAHVFEGCGHIPHREKSDEVLDVVARWLPANQL